ALLRCARRERPRDSRAAEQRDELAPFPLTEMHPIPHGPGAHRRIPDCSGSVSGYASGSTKAGRTPPEAHRLPAAEVRRSGRAAFARDGTEPVFSFFVVGGFCRRLLSFLFLADRPGLAGSPEIRASYSRLVSPSRGARSAGSPARAPITDSASKAQAAKMPVIILRSLIAVRRTSVLSLLIGAVGFIAPGGGGRPVIAGALR